MQPYESHIERLIREATERGEFDNLRGAGKPLDLGSPDDPDWWIKQKLRAEGLDGAGAVPAVLSLRKEAAGFPESRARSAPRRGCARCWRTTTTAAAVTG